MKKVLITESMEQNSIDNLKKNFQVTYKPELWNNHKEIEKQISTFDAIIVRNKTNLNEQILNRAEMLKFIGRLGVGLDNIDTQFCHSKNIHVQPATGMNADSVAEYVLSSSLSLIKNMPLMHQGTVEGNWPRTNIQSREIKGKVLGLLGFGLIARKVSQLAKTFETTIIAHDPFVKKNIETEYQIHLVSFEQILSQSDIISVHLPLNDQTRNLINYDAFTKMKKNPIIINSARGSIINEDDLLTAYNEKLISGFALDVFSKEPVNQQFYKSINQNMNCILSPHIAGVTNESNIRVSNFIVEKLTNFF